MRTPVSYKCGWGSNKTNPHPNLPGVNILVWYAILQAGCIYPWKEWACVIRLAHIPRPLKTTSLRGNIHSARSNPERITQLKMVGWVKPNNNNMDCRVAPAPRNDTKLVGLPTSQNTFTPDAQLARSPRPLWERAEFVSEPCELRNSGEGLKNYHSNHYPPTPFGYCLGFAPRSQNLTFGAELLSVRFARNPDYLTNVRVVRPQIRFPRKGGRGYSVQLALNQFAVIQSPTAIQGRRISKTFSNPVTYTSKELSSRTCFGNLPALMTSTHPNLPSREGTCAVAHLTPMSLPHLVTWSLDHCPQREVLS